MSNERLYKNLSSSDMDELARKTFGTGSPPIDVEQFKKYVTSDAKVLEVGCGPGRVGIELIPDYKYIRIERYAPYLEVFKQRLANKNIDYDPDQLINISLEEFQGSNECFDAVIFSGSVIMDFAKEAQEKALIKSFDLLCPGGNCLLEIPAPGEKINPIRYSNPTSFYYSDWQEKLKDIGFSHKAEIYETETGRKRQLVVCTKE